MRKRVYFIHGFDPRGTKYYYSMLRKEKGFNSCSKFNNNKFIVNDSIEFIILDWSDTVRQYWSHGYSLIIKFLITNLTIFKLYLNNYKCSKIFFGTSVYPIGLMLLAFFISGAVVFKSMLLGVGISVLIYYGLSKLFPKIGATWIMRNIIFYNIKNMDQIISETSKKFAKLILIEENIQSSQEILIIAHSNGSYFAAETVRSLLENNNINKSNIKIITLGSTLPVLMGRHRLFIYETLKKISEENIQWYNFSAVYDFLCFHNFNINRYLEIENNNIINKAIPLKELFKDDWQKIKWNQLFLHFAYLKQYRLGYKYNFFDLIVSPDTKNYLDKI